MGLKVERLSAAAVEQIGRVAPEGGGVVKVPGSAWVEPHIRGKILEGEAFRTSGACRPAVYRGLLPGMVFVLELSGNSNTDRGLMFNDLGQRCMDEVVGGVVRTLAPIFRMLVIEGVTDVLVRGWNGGHSTKPDDPEVQRGAMPFPCLGYEPKEGWAEEWKTLNYMFPKLRIGPWMGRMAAPNVGTIEKPEFRWLTDEMGGDDRGVIEYFFDVIRWHLSLGFRCSGWDEMNIATGSEDEPEDQEWDETPFWGLGAPRRTRGLRKLLRTRFAALVRSMGGSLSDDGPGGARLFQEDAEPGGCETGSSLVRVVSRRKFASMTEQQRTGLYCIDTLPALADKMRGLRLMNPGARVACLMISDHWTRAEFDECARAVRELVPGGEVALEGYVARQVWGGGWAV